MTVILQIKETQGSFLLKIDLMKFMNPKIKIDLIQQLMQHQQGEHPAEQHQDQPQKHLDKQENQEQPGKQQDKEHPGKQQNESAQLKKEQIHAAVNQQSKLPEVKPQIGHKDQPQKVREVVAIKDQLQKGPAKIDVPLAEDNQPRALQKQTIVQKKEPEEAKPDQKQEIRRAAQPSEIKEQKKYQGDQAEAHDQQDDIDIQIRQQQPAEQENEQQQQVIVEHQHQRAPEDLIIVKQDEVPPQVLVQPSHQALPKPSQKKEDEPVRPSPSKQLQEARPSRDQDKLNPSVQSERSSPPKQSHIQQQHQSSISFNELYKQQILKATAAKQRGNQFFKKNKFSQALQHYNLALVYLNDNYFTNGGQQIFNTVCQQKSNICNNICATLLLQEKPKQAQLYAKESLKINPKNRKTAFRLAMVYKAQQRLQEAYNLLKDILADGGTQQEIQTFKVIKQLYKKERKIVGQSLNGFLTKRPSQEDIDSKSQDSTGSGSSLIMMGGFAAVAGLAAGAISKYFFKSQKLIIATGVGAVIGSFIGYLASAPQQSEQTADRK